MKWTACLTGWIACGLAWSIGLGVPGAAGPAQGWTGRNATGRQAFRTALGRALEVVRTERLPYQPKAWTITSNPGIDWWHFRFTNKVQEFTIIVYDDGQVRIQRQRQGEFAAVRVDNPATEVAARLEGVIRSERGEEVAAEYGLPRARLRPRLKRGSAQARLTRGELPPRKAGEPAYYLEGVTPGIYDVHIPMGFFAADQTQPQVVHGVRLHPGPNRFDRTIPFGAKLHISGQPLVSAPAQLERGWLEGTITNDTGKPVWGAEAGLRGVPLRLTHSKGEVVLPAASQLDLGGYFEARDLEPGTYTLQLPTTYHHNVRFASQRYQKIQISAGVLTRLPLVVGVKPKQPSPPVATVTPVRLLK